jgi:primase-polymerase (primpol)-like protein
MEFDIETLERNLPQEIRAMRRFLLWRYEPGKEQPRKVPYYAVRRKAASNRPKTWNTFKGVLDIYKENSGYFNGMGFVLGEGITGVDLDHVVDEDGNLDPEAAKIVDALPGYVERSPSGEGLHILIKGRLPAKEKRGLLKFSNVLGFTPLDLEPKRQPGIEFYDETSPRYLTTTGDIWEKRSVLNTEDASEAIAEIYWRAQKAHEKIKKAQDTAKAAEKAGKRAEETVERPAKKTRENSHPFDYDDDDALLQHIRESNQGAKFSKLFDRGQGEYPSSSEAVAALLCMLAWWTKKDKARMDRLFRQSALYNSEKWERSQNNETLGSIEIRNACESCVGKYDPQSSRIDHPGHLTVPSDIDDKLPTIIARDRQLNPLLREITESLQADEKLFRHGGGLVSVEDGAIVHYTAEAMPGLLSHWANYVDTQNRGMFPPATAAKAVLYSISSDDGIRALERVVNVPTLRGDGTLLNTPGYDAASKLFYHPTTDIPRIPDKPTQEDAKTAAAWILDMLRDFPFDGKSSRDNYLGLLLTFVTRPLCGCVPLALIDAPAAGTGKSLLSKIACITATGGAAAFGVQLGDESETRKNITSRLRDGPSIIVIDNVEDVISSPTLAACLTTEIWEDRLLGRSRMLSLPMRAAVVATGNNLKVGKDMPRRCFYIRLDANDVRPWMRNGFKHRLPEYAIENRGRIAAALVTMARAWICGGRPCGDNSTLGGFEGWCNVVGGILQYAGLPGFLGNLEEMRLSTADEEDDAGAWEVWMAAIYAQFGDEAFTVSHLAENMSGMYGGELREDAPNSLGEIGAPGDRSWLIRLGNALHSHKGQVFDIDGKILKLTQNKDNHKKQKKYTLKLLEAGKK